MDKNKASFWKIRSLSDMLNDSYIKFYSLSKHLAVNEVIMLCERKVTFKHCISNKHKFFCIKIHELCRVHIYIAVED